MLSSYTRLQALHPPKHRSRIDRLTRNRELNGFVREFMSVFGGRAQTKLGPSS